LEGLEENKHSHHQRLAVHAAEQPARKANARRIGSKPTDTKTNFHKKQTIMEKKDLYKLTDEELLVEKKKLNKSKFFHATAIGFLAGILIFGGVAWILLPNKQLGFFIPMLIPIFFIYRMVKNPNQNKDLEDVLKERNLN
jgi:hypothetical protein